MYVGEKKSTKFSFSIEVKSKIEKSRKSCISKSINYRGNDRKKWPGELRTAFSAEKSGQGACHWCNLGGLIGF